MNTDKHPGRIAVEKLERERVTLGFIPLTDCAPLVVAKEKGWFAEQGLDVTLSKETSWANVRDKLSIGVLDGAHMLAPMPLASSLGLGPFAKPMVTAMSLGLNGNAVTVSEALFQRMNEAAPEAMAESPLSARALKSVIDARREAGEAPLTFATVFPYSGHNYQLRYWMAAAGIDPDRDVRLVVVPPPQVVSRLREGVVDGYCVGEPWNQLAVQSGLGRVLITSYEIWNNHPEKVLGVTEEWAEQNPETHKALIRALLQATRWMDRPENRLEVVERISGPRYLNAPEHVVRMSMAGSFQYAPREMPKALPDFNVFHRFHANFPWRSHAVWLLTQMVRWGQLSEPTDLCSVAEQVYQPDIYRQAAVELGIPVPPKDCKPEGEHDLPWALGDGGPVGSDLFLDGRRFDPDRINDYLAWFEVKSPALDLEAFAALNPPRASSNSVEAG